MNLDRKKLGDLGERAALLILQRHSYKIITRNYRNRFGEIDIIALDGETLVFVEVKLRTSFRFGLPEEAVGEKKIEKIKKVGLEFWKKNYPNIKKARVDVVALKFAEGKFAGKIIKIF